jgi:hypothetical protein
MKRMAVAAVLIAMLAASHARADDTRISRVMDVIEAAAAAEGEPVVATIEIVVQATGRERGVIFLNSEADYRDPRNITVEVRGAGIADLRQRFGDDFQRSIVGQRVRVTGPVRRTTIHFNCNGAATGKYYFQTHLVLEDPARLQRVLE